jgi:hypothetical protein
MAAVIAKVADMPAKAPNMISRTRFTSTRHLPDLNDGRGRMFPQHSPLPDPCSAGTYFVLDIYCQQGVENMLEENTTPAGDAG